MDNNSKNEVEFTQSLDFYWRSIAVYAFILIFYSIAFGSIDKGTFMMSATNPVVMLLMLIIIGSVISLVYRASRKRAIIIGTDYIIFKSRFKENKYTKNEIKQIIFAKERIFRSRRKYSIIKFRIEHRKMAIRLRPSAFDEEILLVKMIQSLAKKINHP